MRRKYYFWNHAQSEVPWERQEGRRREGVLDSLVPFPIYWRMDGWLWDEQRRFSDFAGTLHSLFCFPVCSHLRSSRGVPGASPTCCDGLMDGRWWWMVVDGWWWMGSKKVLWFCWKFFQMKFTAYKFSVFWKICEKLFLSEKNPTSSFKIGGIFRKKMFRKFLETSVIISLLKDNSLSFGKKFQKLFLSENNPTLSFKIGGIFRKKNLPQIPWNFGHNLLIKR